MISLRESERSAHAVGTYPEKAGSRAWSGFCPGDLQSPFAQADKPAGGNAFSRSSLRGPQTPVAGTAGIPAGAERARHASWKLDPVEVDMLSILIIGNASTRIMEDGRGGRMLTPRGYAGKYRLDGN